MAQKMIQIVMDDQGQIGLNHSPMSLLDMLGMLELGKTLAIKANEDAQKNKGNIVPADASMLHGLNKQNGNPH